MYWPADYAPPVSDSELTAADRLKVESPVNPGLSLSRDIRTLSDDRTQDSMAVLLPNLPNFNAHPHKGEVQLMQTPAGVRDCLKCLMYSLNGFENVSLL